MVHFFYFSFLALLWVGIWSGAYWYFRSRHEIRKGKFRGAGGSVRMILWLLVPASLCLYCVSYVPFLKLMVSMPRLHLLDDLYVPVQWLFDHTVLRESFLRWADFWHVDRQLMLSASESRLRSFWGTTPPWLYASGWLALGIVWCLLPPFLLERFVSAVRVRRTRKLLQA